MKKLLFIVACMFSVTAFATNITPTSSALNISAQSSDVIHSGRTDKNGCHKETKTGTRHCH